MASARANAALLLSAILVLASGCLTARPRAESDLTPKPCSYHVSRVPNVPSMSPAGARYRAVITATVNDSAGHPLGAASVARLPGGPGAWTDSLGRASFRLSAHDVERTDSTSVMVRRVGFSAMAIPVRVAPGDSIDVVASMCPWSYERSDTPIPTGPEYDHSGVGTVIGAIVGGIVGYGYERGLCETTDAQCTGRHGAIGGAVIGAVVGWWLGGVFTDHAACMPAGAQSANMIHSMRELIADSGSGGRAFATRLGLSGTRPEAVHVVTDERVCRRARHELDSIARASNPSARGMRDVPSVYVIQGGNVIDVQIPDRSSTSYFFDAKNWKRLTVLMVPD